MQDALAVDDVPWQGPLATKMTKTVHPMLIGLGMRRQILQK
jgi:hypothetical protein